MTCWPLANPAYLNDLLQRLLDEVCECLEDTPLGVPEYCFISHTRPPDDCCNYLAVYLEQILPTVKFPTISDVGVDSVCNSVQRMARVTLKLARDCYPVVQDIEPAPFPAPSEIQAAAESLLLDANAVWCCVSCLVGTDGWTPEGHSCLDVKLKDLTMDPPRGGCASLTMNLLIELEQCC